jgi:hypothetical protein
MMDERTPTLAETVGTISPTTAQNIQEIIEVFESREDRARRSYIAELMRVYNGDAQHLVKKLPREDQAYFAAKPKLTPNLTAHALRQISFLYDIPPRRWLPDTESDAELKLWDKVFWSYGGDGWNAAAHEALPLAKLCGQVHALYRYTTDEYGPLAGLMGLDGDSPGVHVDLWTSDQVIALPHQTDQRHARALMLFAGTIKASSAVPAWESGACDVWHYLDDEHYAQLVRKHGHGSGGGRSDWRVSLIPNPMAGNEPAHLVPHELGMIPVQSLRWKTSKTHKKYWARPWGGRDLLPNLSAVYTQLSEYEWTARLQRGQPVGRKVKSMPLGPAHLVELGNDNDSSFTIIANAADLAGMRESVITALELLAKTMGLPSRTFRLQDTAALSGIAIVLDRGELEDQRRGDEQTWRKHEAIAHRMAARIMERVGKTKLDYNIQTTFSPLAPILTPDQNIQLVMLERAEGTMSKREAKKQLHQDYSDELIDELLEAADEEALKADMLSTLQSILESAKNDSLSVEAARLLVEQIPTIDSAMANELVQAAIRLPEPAGVQVAPQG